MAETGIVRTVGGLEFDVTVSEQQSDKLGITEHPVQVGTSISDHAYIKPRELTLVVGKGATSGAEVPKDTYVKLLELQKSREPFSITTGKDEYENMLLEDVSITTDLNTETILLATLTCREVILVETQYVKVTVGKNPNTNKQKTGDRTGSTQQGGSKQAQEQNSDKTNKKTKQSIAYSAGSIFRR